MQLTEKELQRLFNSMTKHKLTFFEFSDGILPLSEEYAQLVLDRPNYKTLSEQTKCDLHAVFKCMHESNQQMS